MTLDQCKTTLRLTELLLEAYELVLAECEGDKHRTIEVMHDFIEYIGAMQVTPLHAPSEDV